MTLRPRAVRTDRQKGSLRAGWPCCAWVSGRCRGRQHRSVAFAGTRHTEGTAVHKADCWPGYSDAGHGVLCVFGKGASGRVCCALTELSGRVCCALEEFFCRACCVAGGVSRCSMRDRREEHFPQDHLCAGKNPIG